MRVRTVGATTCIIAASLLFVGCQERREKVLPQVAKALKQKRDEPLAPLPRSVVTNQRVARLGQRLFFDPKLSKDGKISCASCHSLQEGGDDGLVRSRGIDGKEGRVNAPTVLNAALNIAQFWDGRAATLEQQVDGPVTDSREMGATWEGLLQRLKDDADYAREFTVFPDGITKANVQKAIAEFERGLITSGNRFDRWLSGDDSALTSEELDGYRTFKAVGCPACHQGRNVGGNMYQRFGVMGDYFADRGNVTEADFGRFNVTKRTEDKFFFRVPSLRNVEHTAPYFHDGSAETLRDAVTVMARYQLGRTLDEAELSDIVAFLRTLSDDLSNLPREIP